MGGGLVLIGVSYFLIYTDTGSALSKSVTGLLFDDDDDGSAVLSKMEEGTIPGMNTLPQGVSSDISPDIEDLKLSVKLLKESMQSSIPTSMSMDGSSVPEGGVGVNITSPTNSDTSSPSSGSEPGGRGGSVIYFRDPRPEADIPFSPSAYSGFIDQDPRPEADSVGGVRTNTLDTSLDSTPKAKPLGLPHSLPPIRTNDPLPLPSADLNNNTFTIPIQGDNGVATPTLPQSGVATPTSDTVVQSRESVPEILVTPPTVSVFGY